MTKKDSVCNMIVDEKKAEYISSKRAKSLFVLRSMQKSV
jgi:YHS domain-containing protein